MKIELDDTLSGRDLSKIQANFQKVENALNDNVLWRDNVEGEPNQMEDLLDMNGQRIINLPVPGSPNDAARLQDVLNGGVGIVPASVIPFASTGSISSTNVQAAIEETYAENASAISLLESQLASAGTSLTGAGKVGFNELNNYGINTVGWALRRAAGPINILSLIPGTEVAAIRNYTSTFDCTAIINQALATYSDVYFPAGGYVVNPTTGIILNTGNSIIGASRATSLFLALPQGGTVSNLANYGSGSIIRRKFNPSQSVTGASWAGFIPQTSTDGLGHKFRIANNSVTNHSAKTITITGTDVNNNPINEVINMPTGVTPGNLVTSVNNYKTVTSITPSATIGADVFSVGIGNPYVTNVLIKNIGVVLNHPTASITTTNIQIGIDFRNITRSSIADCHVGNFAPFGPFSKSVPTLYTLQGYGVVFGTTTGYPDYAGGEVNTIERTALWGTFKGVVQDDAILSPNSSAHKTRVADCDFQAAHQLLTQESRYGSQFIWESNCIQQALSQPGNANPTYCMAISGYNGKVKAGYIEAGSSATYIMRLTSTSKSNDVELGGYSATNAALIADDASAGQRNTLRYYENTGAIPGGVDSFGRPIWLFNKAYKRIWVKFHWTGTAVAIDGQQGVLSVVRNGVGDYTITFATNFQTADSYGFDWGIDTNASGHLGGVVVGSHSASNMRIFTVSQNAGVTTAIDPRFVWLSFEQ